MTDQELKDLVASIAKEQEKTDEQMKKTKEYRDYEIRISFDTNEKKNRHSQGLNNNMT